MTDPLPKAAQPGAFWGSILASVRERATTAEVWSAIREASREFGVALPSNMFAEVNRMRSIAASYRRSSENLLGAREDDAITGAMIGQAIYARSASGTNLAPAWHAFVKFAGAEPGSGAAGYGFIPYMGALPSTVGELFDDAQLYAESQASRYGIDVPTVESIQLVAW